MEEIALVFSSLAGACTAVALDKIPRRKFKQTITISSAVENQLHSLRTEKEILTKTITRLHNDDSNISRVQRDKLLVRYQHQIGMIIAKIEKLEMVSRYPDLGPVGDSLITLMDAKLSKMDQRLHEISSKITVNTVQPVAPPVQQQTVKQTVHQTRQEPPQQINQEKIKVEKIEPKVEIQQQTEVPRERISESSPTVDMYLPERRISVELSTLTTIPNKMPEFPAEFIKPTVTSEPKVEKQEPKVEVPQIIVPIEPTSLVTSEKSEALLPKPEIVVEKKIQMPTPIKIPDEEKIEDDDKDLDRIKNEIMKALSKLEQVEVE